MSYILTTVVLFLFAALVVASLSHRKKKIVGKDSILNMSARVEHPLDPCGTVLIGGELWRAQSLLGTISTQQKVRVIGVRGHLLLVRKET